MWQMNSYNKKYISKFYEKSNLILLSTKNLLQEQFNKKLSHKYIESFCILNIIKKQTYFLALSVIYQIHDIFHVFYLELYKCWEDDSTISELLLSELAENVEKYEIEEILNCWRCKEKLWYKIRWKNYSSEYDEWISKHDMTDAEKLCKKYNAEESLLKCSWKLKEKEKSAQWLCNIQSTSVKFICYHHITINKILF